MPIEFYVGQSKINLEYLGNRTGEIVLSAYLISMSEIIGDCKSKGNGALLFISGYTFGILWGGVTKGKDNFYIFDNCTRLEQDVKETFPSF